MALPGKFGINTGTVGELNFLIIPISRLSHLDAEKRALGLAAETGQASHAVREYWFSIQ